MTKQTYEAIIALLLARINPVYKSNVKFYSKAEFQSALREIDEFRRSNQLT